MLTDSHCNHVRLVVESLFSCLLHVASSEKFEIPIKSGILGNIYTIRKSSEEEQDDIKRIIIAEVKDHPFLYVPNDENYKKNTKKKSNQ